MSKLLIVVDYQNDFVAGALGFEAARALEDPIADMVKQVLAEGGRVLFTRDTHQPDYLNTREGKFLPVPHCIKGTDGWHLYGRLAAYESITLPGITILDKPTFGSAQIAPASRTLCGGDPEEILICGVVTNICVVSNAIVLHTNFLNSRITVLQDLCAAPDPADHQNALRLLAGMGYHIQ
ncbi:MAG TPA: cysteine hydrolase [Candidatus Anaerofilum excrementigallinarum]|nr:cysteine hydrolase [Candidatus Anaerofilum excrementigallinarum]